MIYKLVIFDKKENPDSSLSGTVVLNQENNCNGFLEYIIEKGFENHVYQVQFSLYKDFPTLKYFQIGKFESEKQAITNEKSYKNLIKRLKVIAEEIIKLQDIEDAYQEHELLKAGMFINRDRLLSTLHEEGKI